jgi:hypothetical protein
MSDPQSNYPRPDRAAPELRFSLGQRVLGCGCSFVVGIFLMAIMAGAMMWHYIGPPEGAVENERRRSQRILFSFAGLVACTSAGVWLLVARRSR